MLSIFGNVKTVGEVQRKVAFNNDLLAYMQGSLVASGPHDGSPGPADVRMDNIILKARRSIKGETGLFIPRRSEFSVVAAYFKNPGITGGVQVTTCDLRQGGRFNAQATEATVTVAWPHQGESPLVRWDTFYGTLHKLASSAILEMLVPGTVPVMSEEDWDSSLQAAHDLIISDNN